jgi:hypothetical protein
MSLQYETLTFPFSKGVNTKIDPKFLEPPGLTKCENAVFEDAGGIQKRNGFDPMVLTKAAGSTIAIERMRALGVRGKELLLFGEGSTYSWSDNDSEWQNRGRFESVLVNQEQVQHSRQDQHHADRAETSDVICYCWEDQGATTVHWACKDKSTGAWFEADTSDLPKATSSAYPKCIAVGTGGSARIHVYYNSGANLKRVIITPSNVYGTIGVSNATNVATDMGVAFEYDVFPAGVNVGIVWGTTTVATYKIAVHNANGTDTGAGTTAKATLGTNVTKIAGAYEPNHDRISIVRVDAGASDFVRHDWLVASTLANSTFDSAVETITTGDVENVTTTALQAGASYQAYVFYDTSAGSDRRMDLVKRAVINSSGTPTIGFLCRHARLGSKAVTWTEFDTTVERSLVHVLYAPDGLTQNGVSRGTIQPTYFLMDAAYEQSDNNSSVSVDDQQAFIAKLLGGQAGSYTHQSAHLPQIEYLGSDKFACVLLNRQLLGIEGHSEHGLVDTQYTFFDTAAYRGTEEGKTLYLPGGYVAAYDGHQVVEAGIFLFPEPDDADFTTGTAGSMTDDSDYSYILTWAKKLKNGELFRSTHSGAITVSLGVGDDQVIFSTPTLAMTNDPNVVMEVWRTESDPGKDAPYYRVSDVDPQSTNYIPNNFTADTTATFTDSMSDADLIERELLYLNPTVDFPLGQLDHTPAPATQYIAAGQDRLFTLDPLLPHRMWISKIRFSGLGAEFNDALFIDIPQEGGDLVAISPTDSGIVAFKERAIYYIAGQGPDNFGNGSYSVPQPISYAVGCKDPASVVLTKDGTLFKSEKGIYLLGKGLDLRPVGLNVDAWLGDIVVGAIDVPDKHYALMLGDTTGFFMYDYAVNEWSVWPQGKGVDLVDWEGTPVWLDNTAPQKQHALFQDNSVGYSLLVETAWISLEDLPRYHQFSWYDVACTWKDAHKLAVRVGYRLAESGFTDSYEWDPPATVEAVGKRESFINRFSIRKSPAVRFEISDISDGTNPHRESIKLNHLAVKVALKPKLAGKDSSGEGSNRGALVEA